MIQLRMPSLLWCFLRSFGRSMRLFFAGVAEREHRIEAFLDLLDLAAQHAAVERDAVVGGAEVLLGAVGDRPLRAPTTIMSWPSMLSMMYSPFSSGSGTS